MIDRGGASRAPKALLRRIANRVAAPYVNSLENRVSSLSNDLAAARADLARVVEILRYISDEEPSNRRRLYELRRDPSYELAFKERDPLVSFVVPTYDSYETLCNVSLPAILGQSYPNLEVIVIGDGAPPETAEGIAEIDDPRVTYFNRSYRGPYEGTDRQRWLAAGSPPFNEGMSRARGRWIAGMSDDDAVRPDHTRTLVDAAQRHGYEVCYGRVAIRFVDGTELEMGKFPPRLSHVWGQASICHAGLSFIGSEMIDVLFGDPTDWGRVRRMLRIGVYMGMVEEILVDKYETRQTPADYALFVGGDAVEGDAAS